MKKIILISDTHGNLDNRLFQHLKESDEIWHAGDIGSLKVTDCLKKIAPLRAVYGNIDNNIIRREFEKEVYFECENIKVLITHIGGYPPKYSKKIKERLTKLKPNLFICGHSHILKIMYDDDYKLLHINPGAAGKEGFHKQKTIVLLEIQNTKIKNIKVADLGPRVKLTKSIN